MERRLAAILASDLAGYSGFVEVEDSRLFTHRPDTPQPFDTYPVSRSLDLDDRASDT